MSEPKIHIAYLSYDGMTDPLGQSQVLPYLLGLAKSGYIVHLISFEKTERFETGKEQIESLTAGFSIHWYPLRYTRNPPVLSTLIDVIRLNRKLNQIFSNFPIRLIHCRSYITALIGLRFKQKRTVKFLFDMRGFYADERVDGGLWNLSNPLFRLIYKYFKKKEKLFILESDAVVSLTYAGKKEILSWSPPLCNSDHITVIPCCADLNHFNFHRITNEESQQIRKENGYQASEKILVYLGSLGTWYMVNQMMELYSGIHHLDGNWRFLLLTTDDPEIAYETAREKGLTIEHIRVKAAKRNELPGLLSLAEFSVFFIKPTFSKKASSPTKLAELLGMGIPVVCNAGVGDVAEIISTGKAGIILHDFSEESMQNAASQVVHYKTNKESMRVFAFTYADLEEGIKRYQNIYRALLQS